jgi:N-methylhydantoinase B
MQSAGGGGYGDPLTRDPERVAEDVGAGYVSLERASIDYGVVVNDDGRVDAAATADLRQRLAAEAPKLTVNADESSPYEGIRGRARRLRLRPDLASRFALENGDLVELVGRHAAPLRAWVKVDDQAPKEAIPLDAFGRRVLGVDGGDSVGLRKLTTIVRPGERRPAAEPTTAR